MPAAADNSGMHILPQNSSGLSPAGASSSSQGSAVVQGSAPASGTATTAASAPSPGTATPAQLETQLAQITRLAPEQQLLEAKLLKTGQLIQLQLQGGVKLSTGESTERNQLHVLLRQAAGLLQAGSRQLQTPGLQPTPGAPSQQGGTLPSAATTNSQVFLNSRTDGPKMIQLGQLISVTRSDKGFQIASSNSGVNQHLLRLLLPNDKPLNRSLSELSLLATRSSATPGPAPTSVSKTLASILRLIPLSQNISPDIIRHAVGQSGLFAQSPRGSSLEGLLLTLVKQLQPGTDFTVSGNRATTPGGTEMAATTNNMRHLATEALAKILFNQLRPLLDPTTEGSESRRLDLLVRNDDQLNLFDLGISKQVPTLEEEDSAQADDLPDAKTRRWDVKLNFELDQLGEITVCIRYTDGVSLNLAFWAAQPSTFQLLNQQAHGFREHLGDSLQRITGQHITEEETPDNAPRTEARNNEGISISIEVINESHPEPKISLSSQLVDVRA